MNPLPLLHDGLELPPHTCLVLSFFLSVREKKARILQIFSGTRTAADMRKILDQTATAGGTNPRIYLFSSPVEDESLVPYAKGEQNLADHPACCAYLMPAVLHGIQGMES